MPDIATDITLATLTPHQAAARAKVSRGTIMNAIKYGALVAFRDNKNRWQISPDNLSQWLSGRTAIITVKPDIVGSAEPPRPDENTILIAVLEAELKAKDQRISDLEHDRDDWKTQAQDLARRPRRWWPF